jgi:hypothetical protein
MSERAKELIEKSLNKAVDNLNSVISERHGLRAARVAAQAAWDAKEEELDKEQDQYNSQISHFREILNTLEAETPETEEGVQ